MQIKELKAVDKFSLGEFKAGVKQFKGEFEELAVTPTTSEQVFEPSEKKDGFNKVTVERIPEEYVVPSGTLEIKENGEYDVRGYEKAVIDAIEDLDGELAEQEAALAELEADVDALSDKPTDMLQTIIDQTNSCKEIFCKSQVTDLSCLRGLDTSNVTDMTSMFNNCTKATIINVSNFDTSNVTSMMSMFYGCNVVTEIDVSNFDTSNVTDIAYMFGSCGALTNLDLSNFNTSNVKNMKSMFTGCSNLTNLDLSNFNTSNVKDMSLMFNGCQKLNSINLHNFDTSNVSDMNQMFYNCYVLENLDTTNFNTSNVTNIRNMFYNCSKLKTIPFDLDLISVTNNNNMFYQCKELTNVTLKNIKVNLIIGSGTVYGHLLTIDSLLNTFKELHDTPESTTKTLTIGSANREKIANTYVKLVTITDEMRAEDEYIDNKKPFVVCESTDEGAMPIAEYITSKNWQLA